jgi:outer membrane protein OmpA-like peptidoglycan-associated protein
MRCHPIRWLWGLIPIAMLSWIAVHVEADRIESDLEQRSVRTLAAGGYDWASIVFSGRDGLLVGTAPHAGEPRAAVALVRDVWGVRSVASRIRIAAETKDEAPHTPATPVSGSSASDRIAAAARSAKHPKELPAETSDVAVLTNPSGQRTELPPLTGNAAVLAHADASLVDLSPHVLASVESIAALGEPAIQDVVAYEPANSSDANGASEETKSEGEGPRALETAAIAGEQAAPDAGCAGAADVAAVAGKVRFPRGEAALDGRGRDFLDRIFIAVGGCPRLGLRIAGHADAAGASQRNLRLSRRRARAAVTYLVNKGIDASRLEAVGYGETRPAAPNDTAENRAKNRRIEVEVTGLERGLQPSVPEKK